MMNARYHLTEKQKALLKKLPACIMLLCIAAVVLFLWQHGGLTVQEILTYRPANPLAAAGVILLLYAVKGVAVVIPYAVVAAACGIMFPLPVALVLNLIGTILCATIPYWIGRTSGGDTSERLLGKNPRLRQLYALHQGNGFLLSYLLRATHLSNEVLSMFLGSLRTGYGAFLSSSLLGLLPAMITYTVLGDNLTHLKSPLLITMVCITVGISAAVITYSIVKFYRMAHRGQSPDGAA